jgi:hypothetical protein
MASFPDLETNAFDAVVTRIANRRHACCECALPILPGEEYEYGSSIRDGQWVHWKLCRGCGAWADTTEVETWEIGQLADTIATLYERTVFGQRPSVYYVTSDTV